MFCSWQECVLVEGKIWAICLGALLASQLWRYISCQQRRMLKLVPSILRIFCCVLTRTVLLYSCLIWSFVFVGLHLLHCIVAPAEVKSLCVWTQLSPHRRAALQSSLAVQIIWIKVKHFTWNFIHSGKIRKIWADLSMQTTISNLYTENMV